VFVFVALSRFALLERLTASSKREAIGQLKTGIDIDKQKLNIDSISLKLMGIDDESNQVTEGHLVDALAVRGDEGRGTLR
jgi:hypothetical protein